jgi:hypothetical protein
MSYKPYRPMRYDADAPLLNRAAESSAQVPSIYARMVEAAAGRNYVVAQQYAYDLLCAAQDCYDYYTQFVETTQINAGAIECTEYLGEWNPTDSLARLFPAHTHKMGSYYCVAEPWGQYTPGDRLVTDGTKWIHITMMASNK